MRRFVNRDVVAGAPLPHELTIWSNLLKHTVADGRVCSKPQSRQIDVCLGRGRQHHQVAVRDLFKLMDVNPKWRRDPTRRLRREVVILEAGATIRYPSDRAIAERRNVPG